MAEAKDLFTMAGTIIALFVFGKGVWEFVQANAIRRYEKFHQMSVRFDESESIQKVCNLLNTDGVVDPSKLPNKQDKEVFICFLEEVYFMIKSGIMKQDLALHTFGYYGGKAIDNGQFWDGLPNNEPFYVHFVDFCRLAKSYRPISSVGDGTYWPASAVGDLTY